MAVPRVTNRYPRPGERIAPRVFREFLMEPLPERFRAKADSKDLMFCDLDETTWGRFPEETVLELSRIIVDRVASFHCRKVLQQRHLPRPPKGTRLEDFRLENRTRRCLVREGLEDDCEALGDYTISRVIAIRAFGPRCLVDLLCALESPQVVRGQEPATQLPLLEKLTAEAKRLAALPDVDRIRSEDPRFTRLMQALDVNARTAGELAGRLLVRVEDPPEPDWAARQIGNLINRIQGMADLTLEEELIQIFGSTPYERNRKILIGYYGWEDGRQHTLTEIGQRFGITRERIRQVCAKMTKRHQNAETIRAPVMDRALALVERRLPCSAAQIEAELTEQGLTAVGMLLESVAAGARLLGRTVRFKIVKLEANKSEGNRHDAGRLAVRPDQVDAATAIADLARKETYFHGLATVEKLDRIVSEKFPGRTGSKLVTRALELIDGFSWLDERTGWFRLLPIAKHGLPKVIDKILAVASEVTVAEMRAAMSRNRRLWEEPPPKNVLLEYCRQSPGVSVRGQRIFADPPRHWEQSLTGVEAQLVRVLKEHGPVMERGEMEDLCVAAGMNRFSFHAFVSWSPVIAQFGPSVYGLLGAKVSRKQIDKLIASRRAKRQTRRVLDSHGRTDDGKVWLGYRLSKAASTYAVITIPAALKKTIRGRFELLDSDGLQVGTLATRDGRAWGLGAFMRQRRAQIGDHVVITIDLTARTAVVELGKQPD